MAFRGSYGLAITFAFTAAIGLWSRLIYYLCLFAFGGTNLKLSTITFHEISVSYMKNLFNKIIMFLQLIQIMTNC